MLRRLAVVLATVVAVLVPTGVPASAQTSLPDSMDALGNSITRAFDACGWFVDCPYLSWSTGAYPGVDSH